MKWFLNFLTWVINLIEGWLRKLVDDPDPPGKKIRYLVIKLGQQAPVWPSIGAQRKTGYLRDGDAVVIREMHRPSSNALWYEVLTSEFPSANTDIGFVKHKDDKMYWEYRIIE